MSRKTSSQTRATSATSLVLSELHIRLKALEKEQQSLEKQIRKKRTELDNFVEIQHSLVTEMLTRTTPIFKKMSSVDQEVHTLFEEIFTTKKFGKKTEKQIKAVYRNLQSAGIISPKVVQEEEYTEDEIFETNEQENDFSQEYQKHYSQYQSAPQDWESPSASRTDESRKIRTCFLRLAEIFHPDKATGEVQIRHTEIMKEINQAYQNGDLARLLEIERQYEVGESIDHNSQDDLSRKCNILEQQNQILKNQYNKLKNELRSVKNTPEGGMVSEYRKALKNKIDIIAQMLSEIESQIQVISEIRDFVKDFRESKITIKDFVAGPAVLHSLKEEMMEDLLDQMFDDMRGVIVF